MPACCRTHEVIVRKGRNFHQSRCTKCGAEYYSIYNAEKMEYLGLGSVQSECETDRYIPAQRHFIKKKTIKCTDDQGGYDGIPD